MTKATLLAATFMVFISPDPAPASDAWPANSLSKSQSLVLTKLESRQSVVKRWAENLTVEVEVHGSQGVSTAPKRRYKYLYRFYSRDSENARLDELGRDDLLPPGGPHPAKGEGFPLRVTMINRQGSLTAMQTTPAAPMLVKSLSSDATMEKATLRAHGIPFFAFGPVENFVFLDNSSFGNYRILDLTTREYEQGVTVAIHCEAVGPTGVPLALEFEFDEASGFPLRYSMGNSNPTAEGAEWLLAEAVYDFSMSREAPKIISYRKWAEVGSQREVYNEEFHSVLSIDFHPASLELFSPASIGLSIEYPRQKPPWKWRAIGIAGVILIGIYLSFRKDSLRVSQ